MDIFNLAVQRGLIKEDQIEEVKAEALSQGVSLEHILSRKGVSQNDILKLQGEYFNIPMRSVSLEDINDTVLGYIPQE